MTRTQICLVSGQPIPNLIPLRMEEFRPDRVILLESGDMKAQAERLRRVIAEWGITVERRSIAPYDIEAARSTVREIVEQRRGDEVILNATGGTKIMAFAAFEVFRSGNRPIIYVDTQDRAVQVLSPSPRTLPFKSVIKVRTCLAAYGQNVFLDKTDPERVSAHKAVILEIVRNVGPFERAISVLNKYANPHRDTRSFPVTVAIRESDRDQTPELGRLLEMLDRAGIVEWAGGAITFPDLECVEFASGGWLEEYVFDVVNSLEPTNILMGVTVKWDQEGPKSPINEYDVVFTRDNRLYMIECKTKRFEGPDKVGTNDELIYKLESLRDSAGGLYGKAMLVSYRRLTDAQKGRLAANRLAYCDGSGLETLRERIGTWIR